MSVPRQTVTIGNTTLLIGEIIAWRVDSDNRGAFTTVHTRSFPNAYEVRGDHDDELDEALHDASRFGGQAAAPAKRRGRVVSMTATLTGVQGIPALSESDINDALEKCGI